jgi:aminoglycoside 6'-N-acetyltransferase
VTKVTDPVLNFRALSETDLGQLYTWLNKDHLRRTVQPEPISLMEVHAKYLPRLASDHPVNGHLVCLEDQPVGYLQCYRVCTQTDYAHDIGEIDGVGLDLFIGEAHYVGQGIGKQMLRTYVSDIVPALFPDERACFIAHEVTNEAAIHCSLAAGFAYARDVVEEGRPSKLLVKHLC